MNLALSYDASGFIPNKNASIVGLDWNLLASGAITRIVNGEPDDKFNPNWEKANRNIGYIYGQLHGKPSYSRDYIRYIQFINDINAPVYDLEYEYIPDMFFVSIFWVIQEDSLWIMPETFGSQATGIIRWTWRI